MKKTYLILSVLLLLFIASCQKDLRRIIAVNTRYVSALTNGTVIASGEVIDLGENGIKDYGFCWSNSGTPTISNNINSNGVKKSTGYYWDTLTGIYPGSYNIRAYVTDGTEAIYGQSKSITISASLATITTNAVTNITSETATCGGNITSDGGSTITARGVCWNTGATPTIANSKTTDGSGMGSFTSVITSFSPSTTYYVRAYATNSKGTSYGSAVQFTTTGPVPVLTTSSVSNITQTMATCGGNITWDGGTIVTARGVCWSTSTTPTIADNITTDGSGMGSFISAITGLSPSTTYYVRAYATNSAGTGYGSTLPFTTAALSCPASVNDISGNTYNTVTIGTQCWMKENLKTTKYSTGTYISAEITGGTTWANLTTGGWCNYNNYGDNVSIYGRLYNFYAVADSRNICPTGWHVPSDAEWTTLTTYLGGESVAGDKLKETGTTHWSSPNSGNNSSGFTALPGGYRDGSGTFYDIGGYGYWWSSTESDTFSAGERYMYYNGSNVSRSYADKTNGFSVRCVRD